MKLNEQRENEKRGKNYKGFPGMCHSSTFLYLTTKRRAFFLARRQVANIVLPNGNISWYATYI
jgi:hypothetical protein